MACLNFSIKHLPSLELTATGLGTVALSFNVVGQPVLAVQPSQPPILSATSIQQASLEAVANPQTTLTVGEVCSVSGGNIYVLSTAEGPLRLANGDYLLLPPEGEP